MPNTIHQSYFFAHKPETIWEFLTTADLLEQWLMPNDFKPIIGHEFRFTTRPLPSLDFDGVCHCKVLEIIPLKKLSYSWKGGPGDGSISLDTLVQWFLQEKNNGTELRLEHSGFDETNNINIYNGMNDGWNKILQKLSEKINLAKNGPTNA
jgi:uncharacterized protein YndB with AHSA1/START domain